MPVPLPAPLLTCGYSGGYKQKVLGNTFEVGNRHATYALAVLAHQCLPSCRVFGHERSCPPHSCACLVHSAAGPWNLHV